MSRDVYSVAQTVPSEATKWSEPFLKPEPWAQDALCTQTDPDAFFPKRDDAKSVGEAKKVCAACPMLARNGCLEYAIRNDEEHGIWGGLTRRERNKLVKVRAA